MPQLRVRQFRHQPDRTARPVAQLCSQRLHDGCRRDVFVGSDKRRLPASANSIRGFLEEGELDLKWDRPAKKSEDWGLFQRAHPSRTGGALEFHSAPVHSSSLKESPAKVAPPSASADASRTNVTRGLGVLAGRNNPIETSFSLGIQIPRRIPARRG